MFTKLRAWLGHEPVRVRLYTVVVAASALAVAKGWVAADEAPLWVGLVAAVLSVEGTRRAVTPTADPHDDEGRPLTP